MHRSHLCHFVIDIPDLDQGVSFWFWSATPTPPKSPCSSKTATSTVGSVYRRYASLWKTSNEKIVKERMHPEPGD